MDVRAPHIAAVDLSDSQPISHGRGDRCYERFSVRLTQEDGHSLSFERDVLRCGKVVGAHDGGRRATCTATSASLPRSASVRVSASGWRSRIAA